MVSIEKLGKENSGLGISWGHWDFGRYFYIGIWLIFFEILIKIPRKNNG